MMATFYNDTDPFVCQWVRNLMLAGHVGKGHVDERSIQEIEAKDLRGFTRCHFFAGIAGWDLALRLAGWPADEPVWTGSCPCQPFSVAGKGKGQADERHLWPVFFRLIRECKPPVIFGEQVASDGGCRWFARVRDDLEEAGYAVGCADLPACCAGSPHIRQRLFWVAESIRDGVRGSGYGSTPGAAPGVQGADGQRERFRADAESGINALAGGLGNAMCGRQQESSQRDSGSLRPEQPASPGANADRSGAGSGTERMGNADGKLARRNRRAGDSQKDAVNGQRKQSRADGDDPGKSGSTGGGVEHPEIIGLLAGRPCGSRSGEPGPSGDSPASLDSLRVLREPLLHDLSDARTRLPLSVNGGVGDEPLPGFWDAYDLIPCRDGKARRVEPGTFPLAHGVPARVGKLRAYGNAIVPVVAALFIRAYLDSRD